MMMMSFGMILNMILWIAIVGLVIYGVLTLIMKAFEKKEDPALQMLKERFARGEITEEEFKQKSTFLEKK
jgi:putative membrane protein